MIVRLILLLCWTFIDKFFLAQSELTIAINNAFKEAGIQIPFPQQDVHVHWPGRAAASVESIAGSKEGSELKSDTDPSSVPGEDGLVKKW